MGMTVLYIAFGFVALWLLAEVLMQNKARLRWRLLAFMRLPRRGRRGGPAVGSGHRQPARPRSPWARPW